MSCARNTANAADQAGLSNPKHCLEALLFESTPLVARKIATVPETPLPEISVDFSNIQHHPESDFKLSIDGMDQSFANLSEEKDNYTPIVSAPQKVPQVYILPDTPSLDPPVKSKHGRKPTWKPQVPQLDPSNVIFASTPQLFVLRPLLQIFLSNFNMKGIVSYKF